ncbi:MAG: MBL fold metallo-hydrolase [Candidatus Thorarchaeota archaeon]
MYQIEIKRFICGILLTDEPLRIRMYNVGLGDCLLVSIPAIRGQKHLLIDFGSTRGKNKKDLEEIWKNIQTQVGDDDLAVILTHGHMDHFKGLYNHLDDLDNKASVLVTTYHLRTKETRRLGTREGPVLSSLDSHLSNLRGRLGRGDMDEDTEEIAQERVDTDEMLDEICQRIGNRVRYVHRGSRGILTAFLKGTRSSVDILAPEKENEVYLDASFGRVLSKDRQKKLGRGLILQALKERISDRDNQGIRDILWAERSYDNETSLVLLLNWKGKKILFAGDAEDVSWKIMHDKGVLEPFDVLKVSHHASKNGTPLKESEIWRNLMGDEPRARKFLVSTYPRKDWGIPSRSLLKELSSFGEIESTEKVKGDSGFVEICING